MNIKTIFEIPIYSVEQNEFNERWKKIKDKEITSFIKSGHSKESAYKSVSMLNHPFSVWKYNNIIGYIVISSNDVWFDLFCSLDKKYYIKSKTKHFITNLTLKGCHFNINDNMTNKQIIDKIFEWLEYINSEYLKHKFFINYETFNNIINYINFKKLYRDI